MAADHASVSDQVGMAVLRKAMDAQRDEGAQIVKMIQAAAAPADRPQSGRLDVYA